MMPTKQRMRKTIFSLHQYLGLLLGALLAVTGLSGSLLVFDHALDEVLTPQLQTESKQHNTHLQQVLDAAQAAMPAGSKANRIEIARKNGSPHIVRFTSPTPTQQRIDVSVDPNTAQVLAVRTWGFYPMSWVYRLHYTLLAGDTGKTIVGVVGFILLFFGVSGVYLWWPRKGRWRQALRITKHASSLRFYRDFHRVVGVISLPVLGLCAITGITMVFNNQASYLLANITELQPPPAYSVTASGQHQPLDLLIKKAHVYWPDAEIKSVFLTKNATDSLRLAIRLPAEPWQNYAASSLWLNPYSGEVIGANNASQAPLGNAILSWVFPLHNADALGLVGRWLWITIGTIPSVLFVTGVYLWLYKKLRSRR